MCFSDKRARATREFDFIFREQKNSEYNVAILPGEIMKAACVVVCCILLFSASASFGQVGGQVSEKTSPASASNLSAGINLRSVPNAPFSADVVKQSTQLQPDGSRALVETHGKMFRDAEGRTRVETELASSSGAATRHFINIVDPVQQISIVMNVEAKTGTVYHLPSAAVLSDKQLKLIAAAEARRSTAGRSASASEDLGTMTMEGFSVTGTRSAHPVGAMVPEDKTQIAVAETWFSPDLKVVMLSIIQRPQALTQTTRLINVVAGAPDPALFQAPTGYVIEDHSQQK